MNYRRILQEAKKQVLQIYAEKNFIYIPHQFQVINNLKETELLIPQNYLNIEVIIKQKISLCIYGQDRSGKTTLAKALDKQIWEQNFGIDVFPVVIQNQNNFNFCIKQILLSNQQNFNEEQINVLEREINNHNLLLVIIQDNFDAQMERKDFYINNSCLSDNCVFIFIMNNQNLNNTMHQQLIKEEFKNILQLQIVQLQKQQVENYFNNSKYDFLNWNSNFQNPKDEQYFEQLSLSLRACQNIDSILINIIKLSSIIKDFEQEAGNAMMILRQLTSIIEKQDFSFISLKNSSLNEISFHECNFESSQMNSVDISICWFIKCNLNNVQWKNMRKNEMQILICKNQGSSKYINSISFNHDHSILAVGFDNQFIEIWNIKACKLLAELKNNSVISAISFSTNGQMLHIYSNGKIDILICGKNKKLRKIQDGKLNYIKSMVLSPNSTFIACGGSQKSIHLWSVKTGKELQTFEGHELEIKQLEVSPDERMLASYSYDKTLRLWNIQEGRLQLILRKRFSQFQCASFSPNSQHLALGEENYLSIVCLATLEVSKIKGNQFQAVQFSPNGNQIMAIDRDKNLLTFSINFDQKKKMLKLINSLNISPWKIKTKIDYFRNDKPIIKFSSNVRYVAIGIQDGIIRLWDCQKQQQKPTSHNLLSNCHAVAFSQNCDMLAYNCLEKIFLWKVNAGKLTHTFQNRSIVNDIQFSFNSKLLAFSGRDEVIKFLDTSNGLIIFLLTGQKYQITRITSISFSPKEEILASGSKDDCSIILWDLVKRKSLLKLQGNPNPVNQILFSPCGEALATCGFSRYITCGYSVYIWKKNFGNKFRILKSSEDANSIAFSSDGKILATGGVNGEIILWDMEKEGIKLKRLKKQFPIYTLKFLFGEQMLICGSLNSFFLFWNIEQDIEFSLKRHVETIERIEVSPDGKLLASCHQNQGIKVWQIRKKISLNHLDQSILKENVGQNLENQNIELSIFRILQAPLYVFSRELAHQLDESTFKNAQIVSEHGSNLLRLFLQQKNLNQIS